GEDDAEAERGVGRVLLDDADPPLGMTALREVGEIEAGGTGAGDQDIHRVQFSGCYKWTMDKIDIFNHVMPPAYLELVKANSKEPGMVKRMSSLRMLWDIEHRVEMLRTKFPGVRQVLTLGLPAPELLGAPDRSPGFARVANDGMAEMVRNY